MAKITAMVVALVMSAATPQADRTVTFDDITFTRQFVSNTDQGGLAEYVQANETVDNWTKLVAVRRFPQLDNPGAVVAQLAKTLKASNPLARFQILEKPDHSEAMIDFITWPEDASYAEFNVFRYLKRPGQSGLIAYQFAYRFTDASPENTVRFTAERQRWVEEMATADFPIDFAE